MSNIDSILEKALSGERITLEETTVLFDSNEIEKLGRVADELMRRKHPEPITTFNIGRNINYTNVCDVYCRFCAFYRAPGSEEGYVLPNETIYQKIRELEEVGGDEILMQGGVNPDLPFSYYETLLQEIKEQFPKVQVHSFSTVEVRKMKELGGFATYEETLSRLKEAGLDSLPGAGAEMLVDRIRNKISRRKGSWQEWIDIHKAAHRVGLHTTATMVIGFGETSEERALHLHRLREAQDECHREGYPSPGFLAFIVWTFQPDNTNLKAEKLPPEEYLKTVAIARIALDNIDNFQSSWVTMGPEIGKRSLSYGCNDFGSTMMEENVVSAAACTHKVNIDSILTQIREAGKIPAQRNTKYDILRVFDQDAKVAKDFILQN